MWPQTYPMTTMKASVGMCLAVNSWKIVSSRNAPWSRNNSPIKFKRVLANLHMWSLLQVKKTTCYVRQQPSHTVRLDKIRGCGMQVGLRFQTAETKNWGLFWSQHVSNGFTDSVPVIFPEQEHLILRCSEHCSSRSDNKEHDPQPKWSFDWGVFWKLRYAMNMLRRSIVTQPKNGLQYLTNIDVLVSLLDHINCIECVMFLAIAEKLIQSPHIPTIHKSSRSIIPRRYGHQAVLNKNQQPPTSLNLQNTQLAAGPACLLAFCRLFIQPSDSRSMTEMGQGSGALHCKQHVA